MELSSTRSGRFLFRVEDEVEQEDASLDDIKSAIDALNSDGGPSFACLEEAESDEGDYVQVAGGYDPTLDVVRFTVERKIHPRDPYGRLVYSRPCQHLVAGYADRDATEDVKIKTNGYHVTVRGNEVLGKIDVVSIFAEFLTTRDLSSRYAWRSIKDEVEETIRDTAATSQEH